MLQHDEAGVLHMFYVIYLRESSMSDYLARNEFEDDDVLNHDYYD